MVFIVTQKLLIYFIMTSLPPINLNDFLFSVSSNITLPQQQIVLSSISQLSSNVSMINLSSLSSFAQQLPMHSINNLNISTIRNSFDEILTNNTGYNTSIPSLPISDLRSSFDKNIQQLHPANRYDCKKGCEFNTNPQLKCGVPSAITGLITQEPDATKCVINMNNKKQECLDRCDTIQKLY